MTKRLKGEGHGPPFHGRTGFIIRILLASSGGADVEAQSLNADGSSGMKDAAAGEESEEGGADVYGICRKAFSLSSVQAWVMPRVRCHLARWGHLDTIHGL